MPAKNLRRIATKGSYCHVYNKAIEGRNIFNDEKDFEVFLDYLKGYLSPAADPNSNKQTFTVNGRTYKGTPHQPKNYFGRVELTAYSLMPDHFHLILRQVDQGSIEGLIRSLCTRYSIYFNKKYQRSGSLFSGAYKSIHLDDSSKVALLASYLHFETGTYSSKQEYISNNNPWIKPLAMKVLEHNPNENEKELLKEISFDSSDDKLERRILESEPEKKEIKKSLHLKITDRVPEFAMAGGLFLILFTFSLTNINANKIVKKQIVQDPVVLGVTTEIIPTLTPTPLPLPKKMLTIKITDGSPIVNIRKSASMYAEKVAEAKDGQEFEYISTVSGWYRVQLDDGTGFVSPNYVELTKKDY